MNNVAGNARDFHGNLCTRFANRLLHGYAVTLIFINCHIVCQPVNSN